MAFAYYCSKKFIISQSFSPHISLILSTVSIVVHTVYTRSTGTPELYVHCQLSRASCYRRYRTHSGRVSWCYHI